MLLFLLTACLGEGDDVLEPQILGTVSTAEGSADVEIYKAFGFQAEGSGLIYLSSSPDATCSSVSTYLSEDRVDPDGIWPGGTCNVSLILDPWDGDVDITVPVGERNPEVSWNIRCALGEGEFEWTTLSGGNDEDYYWSGWTWSGNPDEWDLSVQDIASEDHTWRVTTRFSALSGNYPDVIEKIPADGVVEGDIEVELCEDLYGADIFPN